MPVIHLHTHTQYSMLDSTIRIPDLVDRAVADGATAIAMTDHNNLFGAVEFFKAAKERGIRSILGVEMSLVDGDRRDPELRKAFTVVLLCCNEAGYRNLCYLLSRAYMDLPPSISHPRIDKALLSEHTEGLIALSGSLSGEIPQAILRGDVDRARELARQYSGLFPGRFYLEVLRTGLKEQERVHGGIVQISEELEIPLVAAADAHYANKEDAGAHEVLMCIQMGKHQPDLSNPARLTEELYLASSEEMEKRFEDLPEALENTQKIADLCHVDLKLDETYLPTYQVPEGYDETSYLRETAWQGLERRLEEATARGWTIDRADYEERLTRELDIIVQMGFSGYFLIVWDFIRHARESGIPVGPGRGSGAGSLVAYTLQITDLDPLHYGLLFERFLNPERVSMPDFDIDFCMHKRDQVIRYVTERYGEHNVGQIITYGTMKAKAVVRDVARVLGLTFGEADRAAKLIPDELGMTLKKAFQVEPRLQRLCNEDERYQSLFDVAVKLEGLNRQPGMHAAGVVIGDRALWDYVPLYAVRGDDDKMILITQYAKNEVEEAGLVKFDFLGLKTLTVVDHAIRIINEGRVQAEESPIDIATIPLDAPDVFKLITLGNTTGVFQMESSGFKELLRKLKPDCLEDIIAAVALYRPGPLQSGMVESFIRRKHGEESVTYPHESLATVLQETYGVIVYQEQVMQAASILAGYSLGQADILRRAMGKKKASEMAKQREVFAAGCVANGVSAGQAGSIFDTIEKFAGYGFNKSHSAAYGLISYQTAWLKTHYPVEFMAALLTCDGDNTDKVVRLIAEARAMNVTVLSPSVNASSHDFTVVDGVIRFGLGAVKGIGGGAVEAILVAREDQGGFEDLYDFTDRVDLRRVNRRVLETLVKCGAFDEFGQTRKSLFDNLDKAIERGLAAQRDRESGQFSLFGELDSATPVAPDRPTMDWSEEEWSEKIRLGFERDCLGFYVSGHPLDRYKGEIRTVGAIPLEKIALCKPRQSIAVAGVVSELRERPLKSGKGRMAFIGFEDRSAKAELLAFSEPYGKYEELLKGDEPLLITASVQFEGEGEHRTPKLRLEAVDTLANVRSSATRVVRVKVEHEFAAGERMEHLRGLMHSVEGGFPVELEVSLPGEGRAIISLAAEYRLPVDDEVVSRVETLLGRGTVHFHGSSAS